MTRLITSLAALCLASTAVIRAADEPANLYVKAGFALSQGDSRDMTRNGRGTTVECGVVLSPSRWDGLQARLYLGLMNLNGDRDFKPWYRADVGNGSERISYDAFQALPEDTRKNASIFEQRFSYDLRSTFAGLDIVWPFRVADHAVSVFTGPSLHQWFVDRLNPAQPEGDRAWRAGWRLGASCQVAERVQVELAYVQSEWRSRTPNVMPYEQGANPSRPGYISATASYRF